MGGRQQNGDGLELFGVFRRRAWLIVGCAVVVAGLSYLLSNSRSPRYEATALLTIVSDGGPTLPGRNVQPQPATGAPAPIVELRGVIRRPTQDTDLAGQGTSVRAEQVKDSNAIEVTATAPQARRAAELANAVVTRLRAERRERERAILQKAKASITKTLANIQNQRGGRERRVALGQRIADLPLQIDLNRGGLELAERAVPPAEAKSPRPRRDAALGGIFGLVLGGALALLWAQADGRVRQISQLEDFGELPFLGAIPRSRALGDRGSLTLRPDDAEAFRVVQANTRFFNSEMNIRSVIVTSAAPGEGKTTLAWNLAVAAASGGLRVMLIEADLRRPSLAKRHGLEDNGGLIELLTEDREIGDVAQRVPIAGTSHGDEPGLEMRVVTAGSNPTNPAGLIASDRMRALIARAELDHDLVVLDTPPVPMVSDAIPLLREVGGVIVVSYLGRSTQDGVGALLSQLRHLDVHVLGLVANGAHRGDTYSYGY
ncbi:MAG: Wzz/FepE/Etk N-terminal domain-containing protein [Thermoleophilaceae bacterium]